MDWKPPFTEWANNITTFVIAASPFSCFLPPISLLGSLNFSVCPKYLIVNTFEHVKKIANLDGSVLVCYELFKKVSILTHTACPEFPFLIGRLPVVKQIDHFESFYKVKHGKSGYIVWMKKSFHFKP